MSNAPPPTELLSVFNPANYGGESADLSFPTAQGTETFPNGVIWGDGTYQNSASGGAGSGVQNPMTSNLNAGGFTITNLANPSSATDAVTLTYFQSNSLTNPMTVNLDIGGNQVIDMADPTANSHAVNLQYANATYAPIANPTLTGTVTIPTAAASANNNTAANTSWTVAKINDVLANSPSLGGQPTSTTPSAGSSSTDIATTAWVTSYYSTLPGPTGPTGPTGTSGPTGPTGPSSGGGSTSFGTNLQYFPNVPAQFGNSNPYWVDGASGTPVAASSLFVQNPISTASGYYQQVYGGSGTTSILSIVGWQNANIGFTNLYTGQQSVDYGAAQKTYNQLNFTGITFPGAGTGGYSPTCASSDLRYVNVGFPGTVSATTPTTATVYASNDYGDNMTSSITWTLTSGYVGYTFCLMSGTGKTQIAISRFNNNASGTAGDSTYRLSTDFGATWTAPNFGLGAGVLSSNNLGIFGTADGYSGCMSKDGTFVYFFNNDSNGNVIMSKSTDGGSSFLSSNIQSTTTFAACDACCSAAGDVIYLSLADNTVQSNNAGALLYSLDYGVSWAKAVTGIGPQPATFAFFLNGIACDETGQLFVGTSVDPTSGTNGGGVWVSRSGGTNLKKMIAQTTANGYSGAAISGNGQFLSYTFANTVEAQYF